MRLLVCGGRDFRDWIMVRTELRHIESERGPISCIIQGECPTGADKWAKIYADMHRIPCPNDFEPDWDNLDVPNARPKYNRWGKLYNANAGPDRNQRMIDDGKPDLVVAFPGGNGTADMVRRAKAAGIEVITLSRVQVGGGV